MIRDGLYRHSLTGRAQPVIGAKKAVSKSFSRWLMANVLLQRFSTLPEHSKYLIQLPYSPIHTSKKGMSTLYFLMKLISFDDGDLLLW